MFVAAHPDDIDMNCGGTIAEWISQGTRAFALIITNGNKGGKRNTYNSSELTIVRAKEQAKALAILGFEEVVFLGKIDGELCNAAELRPDIVRFIRKWKPEALFTHDPSVMTFDWGEINHPDHRVVGEATIACARPFAGGRLFYPEQLVEEGLTVHALEHLFFWETNTPNFFVDVEDFLPTKVAAAACHVSQYPDVPAIERWIYRRAKEIGKQADLQHAECFKYIDLRPQF